MEDYDVEKGQAVVLIKNRLCAGEKVEIMEPRGPVTALTISEMIREDLGEPVDEVHANYRVRIPMPLVKPFAMLRVER